MKRPGEKGYKAISATEEVVSFCGWDYLLSLVENCCNLFEKALISCIFETGGRISEVIQLRKSNFDFKTHPEVIIVRNMPLVKRWTRDRETGRTVHLSDFRTFPIPRKEKLAGFVEEWVSTCPYDRVFGISRSKAFLIVRGVGERVGGYIPGTMKKDKTRPLYSAELTPHILRAERASQLAEDYGFDVFLLNKFFGWKPKVVSMAERYAGMGWIGLAREMGVDV